MNKLTIFALFAFLCVASSTVVRKSPKQVFMDQTLAKMGGLLCDMCKDLVKDGEAAGEKYSDHWLDGKINEVCQRLGFFADTCVKMLTDCVGDLDSFINQKLSPEVSCTKVELC